MAVKFYWTKILTEHATELLVAVLLSAGVITVGLLIAISTKNSNSSKTSCVQFIELESVSRSHGNNVALLCKESLLLGLEKEALDRLGLGACQTEVNEQIASFSTHQWIKMTPQCQVLYHRDSLSLPTAFRLGRKSDVNLVTYNELLWIPGVGPKLAAKIVRYRQTHGEICDLADLEKVKKIGPAIIENLKKYVYASCGKDRAGSPR